MFSSFDFLFTNVYESRNKRTVDSFRPENYIVNLRIVAAGPF